MTFDEAYLMISTLITTGRTEKERKAAYIIINLVNLLANEVAEYTGDSMPSVLKKYSSHFREGTEP